MQLNIDEATVHLAAAAFRLGRRDANAEIPQSFLKDCVDLIQADNDEDAAEIIQRYAKR